LEAVQLQQLTGSTLAAQLQQSFGRVATRENRQQEAEHNALTFSKGKYSLNSILLASDLFAFEGHSCKALGTRVHFSLVQFILVQLSLVHFSAQFSSFQIVSFQTVHLSRHFIPFHFSPLDAQA